jgi:hypothetical protein
MLILYNTQRSGTYKNEIFEMGTHIALMVEMRHACKILAGEPQGKRPLWSYRPDGRIILKWILVCEGVDWINLVRDRVEWRTAVNTVMNLRVP